MKLRQIIKGILRRFFNTQITKIHYLKVEISSELVYENTSTISIPVTKLSYDNFLIGDKSEFNDQKLSIYTERFKDDFYSAYGIIVEGKLAYSSWISLNKLGLPADCNDILLQPDEGYLEDDYCDPEFRGKGIHTQMLWFRLNELLSVGKKYAVITIADGNMPALKAAYKCGFKSLGTFYCGKLLGYKLISSKSKLKNGYKYC